MVTLTRSDRDQLFNSLPVSLPVEQRAAERPTAGRSGGGAYPAKGGATTDDIITVTKVRETNSDLILQMFVWSQQPLVVGGGTAAQVIKDVSVYLTCSEVFL